MSLNISQLINDKYAEVEVRLAAVNAKIETSTTNREKLIAKREKLKDMLARLKAIQFQSSTFNKLEGN